MEIPLLAVGGRQRVEEPGVIEVAFSRIEIAPRDEQFCIAELVFYTHRLCQDQTAKRRERSKVPAGDRIHVGFGLLGCRLLRGIDDRLAQRLIDGQQIAEVVAPIMIDEALLTQGIK